MKQQHTKAATLVATLITFGSLAGGANAAVTLTNIGANQYSGSFDPIMFSVTSSGSLSAVLFEDFFTSSATSNGNAVSGSFTISLNSAPTVSVSHENISGVFSGTFGLIDNNDLFFNLADIALTAGDTLTISGENLVFSTTSNLALPTSGSFSTTLTTAFGVDLSDDVSVSVVPEPSSTALLGLGALGMVIRRKRTS